MRVAGIRGAGLLLSCSLSAFFGCDPNAARELGRGLLAPEVRQLGESRLLVDGVASQLSATSSADGRIWVQVVLDRSGKRQWWHGAINGSASCTVDDIVDYRLYDPWASIWSLQDADGSLLFVNDACDPVAESLAEAKFPEAAGGAIETERGDLFWLVEHETLPDVMRFLKVGDSQTRHQTRSTHGFGRRLWTLDAGRLVQRDVSGGVVREYPGQVSEFATLYDGSTAFVSSGKLYAHAGPDGPVGLLAEDTCSLSEALRVFVHHTPCKQRRLALTGPVDGTAGMSLVEPRMLTHYYSSHNILPDRLRATFWTGDTGLDLSLRPALFYLTSPDPAAMLGSLVYDSGNGVAAVVGEGGFMAMKPYTPAQPFIDWQGDRGTAVTRLESAMNQPVEAAGGAAGFGGAPGGEPGDGALGFIGPAAVPLFHDDFVLLDERDGAGDLVRSRCGADQVLGRRVPVGALSFHYDAIASGAANGSTFVGNVDERGGDLFAVRECDVDGPLSVDVVPGSVRALQVPRALVYLAQPAGDGTATLRAWLFDAEVEISVSPGVELFAAMPLYGVVYSVPAGEQAGIWLVSPK